MLAQPLFQQTYPLPIDMLNTVDSRFTFVDGGGFMVGITPTRQWGIGFRPLRPSGYKDYAGSTWQHPPDLRLLVAGRAAGRSRRWGANEGTTGVWDGIMPVVIATDDRNTHSFMWGAHYALAMEAKRRATMPPRWAAASDLYAGLTTEERAALNELLNAGFRVSRLTACNSPSGAQPNSPARSARSIRPTRTISGRSQATRA